MSLPSLSLFAFVFVQVRRQLGGGLLQVGVLELHFQVGGGSALAQDGGVASAALLLDLG